MARSTSSSTGRHRRRDLERYGNKAQGATEHEDMGAVAHTRRILQDAPCCTHTRHSANAAKPSPDQCSRRPAAERPAPLPPRHAGIPSPRHTHTHARTHARTSLHIRTRCTSVVGSVCSTAGTGHGARRRLVQQICSHTLHAAWQESWRSLSLGDGCTPSSIDASCAAALGTRTRGAPWASSGLATAGASAVPADPICRRAPGGRAPAQAAITKLCRVGLLDSSRSLQAGMAYPATANAARKSPPPVRKRSR